MLRHPALRSQVEHGHTGRHRRAAAEQQQPEHDDVQHQHHQQRPMPRGGVWPTTDGATQRTQATGPTRWRKRGGGRACRRRRFGRAGRLRRTTPRPHAQNSSRWHPTGPVAQRHAQSCQMLQAGCRACLNGPLLTWLAPPSIWPSDYSRRPGPSTHLPVRRLHAYPVARTSRPASRRGYDTENGITIKVLSEWGYTGVRLSRKTVRCSRARPAPTATHESGSSAM
jgi:hypothetical protein